MQDDGAFFMTGPDSKPGDFLVNLDSDAKPANLEMSDGTSNTFMFGEKYHDDKNFEELLRPGGSTSV